MRLRKIAVSLILAHSMIFSTACTPQPWETLALQIAQTSLPIAAAVFSVADPKDAALAQSIEGGAQVLVGALQTAAETPNAGNVQQVVSAVNALQSQTSSILAALQVKDPASVSSGTAYATLFAQVIDQIAAIISQNTNTLVALNRVMPRPMMNLIVSDADGTIGALTTIKRTGRAPGYNAKDFKKALKRLNKKYGRKPAKAKKK